MPRAFLKILYLGLLVGFPSAPLFAAPAKPSKPASIAVVYEPAPQGSDRAFIQSARDGTQQARKQLGIQCDEFTLESEQARENLLRSLAEEDRELIVAVGFQNVVPIIKLAEQYPSVHFTVIDGVVPPLYRNVQSIIFKDQEGAFLIGMIAAYTSKSGKIGFIGGMDVPLIRNFAYGYLQGAKFAFANIRVVNDMIGLEPEAWQDQNKAYQLARKQFGQGVDVIFAAAGGATRGVLRAAKEEERLAIGVDTNQNSLYPGHVLTSLVKRVDKAVFQTLKNTRDGNWQPGVIYLGIAEGALDYSLDQYNKELISKEIVDKVETAKDLIIRGIVPVLTYTPD